MEKKIYPIKVVAQKSGLSQHLIRAWEKRYGAVIPERSKNNRRLYNKQQVEKLVLLKKIVEHGYNIGSVADLPIKELKEILDSEATSHRLRKSENNDVTGAKQAQYLEESLQSIVDLDANKLESILMEASVSLSIPELLNKLVIPLTETIGYWWSQGTLRVYHEHMATAVIKTFLANLRIQMESTDNAPRIIVATPKGQLHEIGALIVGVLSAWKGWGVTYLGPNLPAEEIAAASRKKDVKAIALSIVFPANDPAVIKELQRLRRFLPDKIIIIVGGRAAKSYLAMLEKINAVVINDIKHFQDKLMEMY